VEALADVCEVVGHLLDEKLTVQLLVAVFFVELYDAGVVKVADLLEAGLVDVALHVFINFANLFHLACYLVTNYLYVQLIVGLVQNVTIDVAECQHE
jgi:hypothetical protein